MGLTRIGVLYILHTLCFLNVVFCQDESAGIGDCDFQISEADNAEQLQPPSGCMLGSFLWYNPSGSVKVTFPRSLLPSESRGRMRVCLRTNTGEGVTDMFHLVGMGKRRPGELKLYSEPAEGEDDSWSCSRPSRRDVAIVLYAEDDVDDDLDDVDEEETDETDYEQEFQELEYKIEVTQHSGRRPNQPRPGSGSDRRPGRRPGGRGGNRNRRNRRPKRKRGGKKTFPLETGQHPRDIVEDPGN